MHACMPAHARTAHLKAFIMNGTVPIEFYFYFFLTFNCCVRLSHFLINVRCVRVSFVIPQTYMYFVWYNFFLYICQYLN